MIIYMKKSYKKRNRKRSTKKRARIRTRKAGEYSKMHNDLVKARYEKNKYQAQLGDVNEAAHLQRIQDKKNVFVATRGRGIFGPDGIPVSPSKNSNRRAGESFKRLSNRIPKLIPRGRVGRHNPLNARERLAEQKIRGTKRKREQDGGKKRKRKTRRRRRRRR